MTTTTTSSITLPTTYVPTTAWPYVPKRRQRSEPTAIPDVWHERAIGLEWCDCGDHCPLTKAVITTSAKNVLGGLPEHITHQQVVAIAQDVWAYESICRFFTMAIEQAAIRICGQTQPDYPLETGLAIVKAFSNRWNGCPEEGCAAHPPDHDIDNPDSHPAGFKGVTWPRRLPK